jgi:hypothetical protein
MKTCFKCNTQFPLTEEFFGCREGSPDGYRNDCKGCVKKRRHDWHEKNREEQLCKMKEYWVENIETMHVYKKEYNEENRDSINAKCHDYYWANRDKVLSQMKEFRDSHKEEIKRRRTKQRTDNHESVLEKRREYSERNRARINAWASQYCAKRKQVDIPYRILHNTRTRIAIASRGSRKSDRTIKLIGCTASELKKHLESQFTKGMTWKNYGRKGWHVDHICPCALFDLSDPEQQKICFHYTNLQPLWASDNSKKGARMEFPFQIPLSLAS